MELKMSPLSFLFYSMGLYRRFSFFVTYIFVKHAIQHYLHYYWINALKFTFWFKGVLKTAKYCTCELIRKERKCEKFILIWEAKWFIHFRLIIILILMNILFSSFLLFLMKNMNSYIFIVNKASWRIVVIWSKKNTHYQII